MLKIFKSFKSKPKAPAVLGKELKVPTRYVRIDKDGDPLGFYSDDIHIKLPEDAIKITEVQYKQWHQGLCIKPLQRYRLVNGQLISHTPVLTMAQQAIIALSSGLTITGEFGTGTFSLNLHSLQKMDISLKTIKSGCSYPMCDTKGVWVKIKSEEYKLVADTLCEYATKLHQIVDGNPLKVTSLPPATVNLV